MTVVNVYDMAFNLIGVVDSYISLIWRPAYYDVGDFELYLSVTDKEVELLSENRLLVRDSDISLDEDGKATYKNVMIIKNIDIITDTEKGDYLNVTGRELKYMLHQRIVWSQTNLTDTAEAAIRQLVTENAVSPTDSRRSIPRLVLGAAAGLTETIEKQITGQYLDEAIKEICTSNNYGWEIYGYNGNFVFIEYKGLDRSYGQSERPYVVFSETFENLYNTEYQKQTEAYANTTLIGGEGEGSERKYATVGADNTGLNRYEVFTDAKSVSSKADNTTISAADYTKMLEEKGKENLAKLGITEGFSGEVLSASGSNYVYGEDFFIGDTVTVISRYGFTKNVMVLSAIESEDEHGIKLVPQFNI